MNLVKTESYELAVYVKGDARSEKLALVLPGKLDTKDYPHMRSYVNYLAGKGYLALSFDPPGTWESPGSIQLYTTTNYIEAVHELVAHFGNRSTFVLGHSLGGSVAMQAGISNEFVTHYASIMSPYFFTLSNEEEWKKRGYRISERDVPGTTAKKQFKLPYSFSEDQAQYDLLDDLKKSTKPKMFVLGEKDTIVKPELVKEAYEAAAEPKFLYKLNSGHDYRHFPDFIDQVNAYIGDFLSQT